MCGPRPLCKHLHDNAINHAIGLYHNYGYVTIAQGGHLLRHGDKTTMSSVQESCDLSKYGIIIVDQQNNQFVILLKMKDESLA